LERAADGEWRDVTEEVSGRIDRGVLDSLADCLGGPRVPGPVPPMWWIPATAGWPPRKELGADGHPVQGFALPPLPDRRRLFAGGRVEVHGNFQAGEVVTRTSRVVSARARVAATGPLLFVTAEHRYRNAAGQIMAVEQHELAYRSGPAHSARAPASPPEAETDTSREIRLRPDSVTLFRFSALTANSHRIHYDHPYATGVEGLGGLLVHGPLLAMLLLELPRRHAAALAVSDFTFRVHRPVESGTEIRAYVAADTAGGWEVRAAAGGAKVISGVIRFRPAS
jgi:3-methylfumaryl-CoA hydratase